MWWSERSNNSRKLPFDLCDQHTHTYTRAHTCMHTGHTHACTHAHTCTLDNHLSLQLCPASGLQHLSFCPWQPDSEPLCSWPDFLPIKDVGLISPLSGGQPDPCLLILWMLYFELV